MSFVNKRVLSLNMHRKTDVSLEERGEGRLRIDYFTKTVKITNATCRTRARTQKELSIRVIDRWMDRY